MHLEIIDFDLLMNAISMLSSFLKAAKNSFAAKEEQIIFRDCAEAFKSGLTTNGIYTLTFPNSTEEIKVRDSSPVFDSLAVGRSF